MARVLLEGGDTTGDNIEKELEQQREKDIVEGRKRGRKSRSPVRPRSRSYQEDDEDRNGFDPYPVGARKNPPRSRTRPRSYNEEVVNLGDPEAHDMGFYSLPIHDQQPNYYYTPDGYGQQLPPPLPLMQGGYDFPDLDYVPATPRTLAMNQHQQNLQHRMRNTDLEGGLLRSPTYDSHLNLPVGPMLSPIKDSFGNSINRNWDQHDMHRNQDFGYNRASSFFESNNNHNMSIPRAFLADNDSENIYSRANMFDSQLQSQLPTGIPQYGSELDRLLGPSMTSVPFSAFGEMAVGSTVPQGHDMAAPFSSMPMQDMALQPNSQVQYVYLSREQVRTYHISTFIKTLITNMLLGYGRPACRGNTHERFWYYLVGSLFPMLTYPEAVRCSDASAEDMMGQMGQAI